MKKILIIISLCLFTIQSHAYDAFLNESCDNFFPESMLALRDFIEKKGYTISRVQRVDVGLRQRGYKTGFYRVIFFGKNEEIQMIRKKYPSLIPYMPLTITIFESGDKTGITAVDPDLLQHLYASNEIQSMVNAWSFDVIDIFREYSKCE